jgi:hypothetical protein
MKNYLIVLMMFCTLAFNGCKGTEEKPCIQEVQEEQIFEVSSSCSYKFKDANGITHSVKLLSIEDRRQYGLGCESSLGGSSYLKFLLDKDTVRFTWRGCTGSSVPSFNNSNIPNFTFGSYSLRMVKMYPLTENLQALPTSIESYKILLAIINK